MRLRMIHGAAAIVGAVALALGSLTSAVASPAYAGLYAGGCGGQGHSWLSSPGGYDYTVSCSAGARYLSGSLGFSDGVHGDTLPGNWYSYDVYWGATPGREFTEALRS
jgi:hypothetical protein